MMDEKQPLLFKDWPKPVFAHDTADARLFIVEQFLTADECDAVLRHLETLPLEHEPKLVLFGRVCRMRRSVGFFTDDAGVDGYSYAGQKSRASPLTPGLRALLRLVERTFGAPTGYNGILVNKYVGGSEYISRHSDDEHELSASAGVVCLSLGATRTMEFRSRTTPPTCTKIAVNGGSLMCMHGAAFQREYTHEIKPLGKRAAPVGVRYSLTFRKHASARKPAK